MLRFSKVRNLTDKHFKLPFFKELLKGVCEEDPDRDGGPETDL